MNVNMVGRKRKTERSDQRARKSVGFKKRKACLVKKTMELSVLCDIQACIVITEVDGEVTMWPENQTQVMKILQSSKNVSPTNTTDQETTVGPVLLPPVPAPPFLSDDPLDWEDSVLEYLLKDSDFFVCNAESVSQKEGVTNNNILDFPQLADQKNCFLDFQELMEKVDERLQAVTERINFLESSSPSISIAVSEPDQSGQIATVVSATQSQTPFFDCCFNELRFAEEDEILFPKLRFLEDNDRFTEIFPI